MMKLLKRLLNGLLVLFLIIVVLFALPKPKYSEANIWLKESNNNLPLVMAHSGGKGVFPDNTLSAFEYETTDMNLVVSGSSMKGVVEADPRVKGNSIKLEMDEIVFKQGAESLKSFRNELVLNLFSDTQNKLTTSILMTDDARYTGMTVNMDNLRLEQLLELMVRYEDRYSNEQQIEWTLESAAQYQEGRERLISLFSEKEDLVLTDTGELLSQLLKQGANDISFIEKIDDTELAYNK